jgi:hypothetical protein
MIVTCVPFSENLNPPHPLCRGSGIASRQALKVAGRACRRGVRCSAWCIRVLSGLVARASYVFRRFLRVLSGPVLGPASCGGGCCDGGVLCACLVLLLCVLVLSPLPLRSRF